MLRFLDQILEFIRKFLSSQRIQEIIKVSPFLIIPIVLYLLGQQYLKEIHQQKLLELENEKIEMILSTNQELRAFLPSSRS